MFMAHIWAIGHRVQEDNSLQFNIINLIILLIYNSIYEYKTNNFNNRNYKRGVT